MSVEEDEEQDFALPGYMKDYISLHKYELIVIVILVLSMLLMLSFHLSEIDRCNTFWVDKLNNVSIIKYRI